MLVFLLSMGCAESVQGQAAAEAELALPSERPGTHRRGIHITEATRAYRLGTILESSDLFASWWTDGYSLRLADGLSGPLGPPPAILVDGMPMPVELFGRVHLAALPVSAFDVESMSWQPGIGSAGFLTSGGRTGVPGVLRISTIAPEGTTLRGSIILVNDTGDPGPDRYRNGGRNVDRSGPRASLRASVNEGRWFAEAALDADEHHMTDERIVSRIRRVYGAPEPPVIRVFHPHGRIRYDVESLVVDVRAGRMTADDFLFIDELAQEWPNRRNSAYMVGRADWTIDDRWTAGLATAVHRSRIESRDMSVAGPPALRFRLGHARASLTRQYETGSTTLAAGIRSEDVEQTGQFARQTDARAFAEVGYDRRILASTFLSIDLGLAQPVDTELDPGTSSSTASITLLRHVDRMSVSAGTSIASNDRPSLTSMSRLVAAGFDTGELGASVVDAGLQTRERLVDVFVRFARRDLLPGRSGAATRWLDVRLRRSQGLSLPEVEFLQLQDKIRFTSDPVYGAGNRGLTWQVAAGLEWQSSGSTTRPDPRRGGTRVRVVAKFRGVLSGTEPFRIAGSGLPVYELHARLRWSTSTRFGAEVSARLDGARTWRMYEQTPFGNRPVQTRLDAALWKRIAGDSTLLTLGLRNVVDTAWRTHPAGIHEQLAVRAGMSVTFNRSTP